MRVSWSAVTLNPSSPSACRWRGGRRARAPSWNARSRTRSMRPRPTPSPARTHAPARCEGPRPRGRADPGQFYGRRGRSIGRARQDLGASVEVAGRRAEPLGRLSRACLVHRANLSEKRGPPRRASDPPTGPPEVDFVRDVHGSTRPGRACSWGAPDRRPGQRRSSIRSWHANGRRDGGGGRGTGGRRAGGGAGGATGGGERTRADAHGPRDATRRAIAGPPRNWLIVPEPIRAPGRCGPPRPGPPASGPRRSRSRPGEGRRQAGARSSPR